MEKLQPVIRNKFWIFAVIAILTPIYPWMTTLDQMKAAYSTGDAAIKTAQGQVPTDPNPANQNWSKPVQELTTQQQGRYVETQKMLWDLQKPLLKWPDEIQAEIVQNSIPYLGELPTSALRKYKTKFPGYKYELWKNTLRAFTPKPVGPIASTARPNQKTEEQQVGPGKEVIAFPFVDLPLPELEKSQADLNSREVWEAQEDLWLLKSIFSAIDNVNAQQPIPAQSQMNSVIKQIYKVELRGGAKSRLNPGPPGSSSAGPSFAIQETSNLSRLTGSPGTTPYAPPGSDMVTFSFDASEEFGPGQVSKAPNASAQSSLLSQVVPRTVASKTPALPQATSAPGTGKVVLDPKRYVDKESPGLNLRTRAFYIELLMDNEKIPQLLTEFRNSPWPTRLYRVQIAAKDNAASPVVNLASPTAPGALNPQSRGPIVGSLFGGGRGRDEDDAPFDASPLMTQAVDAGPLSNPRLCYVAIAGLITIYVPPDEAEAKVAFASANVPSSDAASKTVAIEAPKGATGENAESKPPADPAGPPAVKPVEKSPPEASKSNASPPPPPTPKE